MKPLKLTMQSFGSYGQKTEIDFQKLNQNIFLITGDTGAGKTTIFDAIVFALYGEASSVLNKKDGVLLQSQYSDYSNEPFVELTFSEGNGENTSVYTVKRVPKHIKVTTKGPLRGQKTRDAASSVSLIMPDGTEYPSKETNKKLIEIVGLTKNQFMQIAMIAQGEFMELLRAKSNEKKEIFRKLFNTELYRDIIDEFDKRKKEKEKEIHDLQIKISHIVASVEISDDYENWEKIFDLRNKIIHNQITYADDFFSEFGKFCDWMNEVLYKSKKEYETADRLRDEKKLEREKAATLIDYFNKLDKAKKDLEDYRSKEERIHKTEHLIKKLRSAYEIKPKYELYSEAKSSLEKNEADLHDKKESLPILDLNVKRTMADMETAKKLYDDCYEKYNRIDERVKKSLKCFERVRELEKDEISAGNELSDAQRKFNQKKEELQQLKDKEKSQRIKLKEMDDVPEQKEKCNTENLKLNIILQEIKAVISLWDELKKCKEKISVLNSEYLSSSQKFKYKNNEYENLRQAFLDNQAGILAKGLVTGEPCPVCGSLEHPKPFVFNGYEKDITKEMLQSAREEKERLDDEQKKISLALSEINTEFNLKQKTFNDKFSDVKSNVAENFFEISENITPADLKNIICERLNSNRKNMEVLERKCALIKNIQSFLENSDKNKNVINSDIDKYNAEITEKSNLFTKIKTERESLISSVAYKTEKEAEAAMKEARSKAEKSKREFEYREKSASEAQKAKNTAETIINRLEQDLPKRKERLNVTRNEYITIMSQKNLSEKEWSELTEKYTSDKADKYQRTVTEYESRRASAEKALEICGEFIDGKSRPEIKTAEAEADYWEKESKKFKEVYYEYQSKYKTNISILKELKPMLEKRKNKSDEYSVLKSLYDSVSGNVSGSRMDLETYVQRCYLKKILASANRRFQSMSAGQFELRMYDIEKAGDGKNKGLDLMVYSTVTGKKREVRTLSGGESFMAALSLALGTADQIRESSAAINLDMMFIDEGFGSLDDHSRNQAVRVLREMAEGSRLIGIISHVTELKREIEDRLIVSKNEYGSNVRWQLS